MARSGDPRNCMPSLHTSWALLLYWHSRRLGPVARIGCAAWLVATILATLALGQHYFVDLVVAVPFAALIDALVSLVELTPSLVGRDTAIAVNAALLVSWYVILFWAPAGLERGPTMLLLAAGTVVRVGASRPLGSTSPAELLSAVSI